MTKAVIALIISTLQVVDLWTGWGLSTLVDEHWIETLLAILNPILVWLVPNRWIIAGRR